MMCFDNLNRENDELGLSQQLSTSAGSASELLQGVAIGALCCSAFEYVKRDFLEIS